MTEVTTDRNPTLLDIWLGLIPRFDLAELARQAEVPEKTVQNMMDSLPVEREDALKVLAALSEYLHEDDISLDTVHVVLTQNVTATSKSDYVRTLRQIDAEFVASWRALYGFAQGTAQHQFISKRFANIGNHLENFRETIGDETITDLLVSWNETITGESQVTS